MTLNHYFDLFLKSVNIIPNITDVSNISLRLVLPISDFIVIPH